MSLFDTEVDASEKKLPTYVQYLKKQKGKTVPKEFFITKIWFPTSFDSYGIETEKFRLSVKKDSPMGKLLTANVESLYDTDLAVHLVPYVTEDKTQKFLFKQTKSKVYWEFMGNDETTYGLSCSPQ